MALLLSLTLAAPAMGQSYSGVQSQEEIVPAALRLAKTRHYAAALSLLETADPITKTRYDHRFAKARILTWAKLYKYAEQEYRELTYLYPDNADIRVSYGYLQLFSGNLDLAQQEFESVLKLYPGYADAQSGLVRTRAARQNP